MLSKSCEYALRAMLYIALKGSEENKIGIKQIAEQLDLPSHFLGKTLQNLSRHQLVSSVKGPNGGFYLTDHNKKNSLIKVVEVVDGLYAFHRCGLGLKECSDNNPCPIHHSFKPFRDNLMKTFEDKSIEALAEDVKNGDYRITLP